MAIRIYPSQANDLREPPGIAGRSDHLLTRSHPSPRLTSMQSTHGKPIANKPREQAQALEVGLPEDSGRGLLTSAFIHAPGLGPDFKRIWLFLPRAVGLLCSGGLCRWVLGEHLCAVAGGGRVQAAVAGDAVLGAVLAVFSLQWLLKGSE